MLIESPAQLSDDFDAETFKQIAVWLEHRSS